MTIEGIPIKQLWALLARLPKFFLRRKFTPETLAGLVYVDLRPRHDPATLDLGQSATFELWLQVINLSPFEVELDRADFGLRCGPILRAGISRRQKIAPGEITSLRVHGSMTDGQADEIGWSLARNNPISLEGHMDFNCALHSFPKTIYNLEGICPRVINANARGQK
jgi:hypothetical protein